VNTRIPQSRAPRHGLFAALALTGAAASVMLLPLGMGVASASAGFSTVQAGGPPAPVKHVYKPSYVPREKPILRNPHYRPPRIDVIVDNRNHSRNHHPRHRFERREEVKPAPVVKPVKEEPVKEDVKPDKYDDGNWWWPEELS
jgi:hypothetical protein